MAQPSMIVAGIDTGKAKLDCALSSGRESLQVDNTPSGHAQLVAWLARHGVTRIGIEASGGYEAPVVAHLRALGIGVTCFQPAQVRAAVYPERPPCGQSKGNLPPATRQE